MRNVSLVACVIFVAVATVYALTRMAFVSDNQGNVTALDNLRARAEDACDEAVGEEGADEPTWHEQNNLFASDYFDDPKVVALCKAIERDNLDEIDHLVAGGADVNAQGSHGWTPLFWSIVGFEVTERESFRRLLENGADPNQVLKLSNNGWAIELYGVGADSTIVSLAATAPTPSLLETLHEFDADLRMEGASGRTPLFAAAEQGRLDNAKYLLAHGAEVDHRDNFGNTPLERAITGENFDIALLFLKLDADWRAADANGYRIDFVVAKQLHNQRIHSDAFDRMIEFLERDGFDYEQSLTDCDRFYQKRAAPIRIQHESIPPELPVP